MKSLSYEEIINVLDREIKSISDRKNAYIQKNGYSHVDTLNGFANQTAELIKLLSVFKEACNEDN